jgi:hypothetical protein
MMVSGPSLSSRYFGRYIYKSFKNKSRQCNTTEDSETRRLLLRGMLLLYMDTHLEFPLDYIPFIYLPISFLLTIE